MTKIGRNEQEEEAINEQAVTAGNAENRTTQNEEPHKKKYHSSAMYATSKLHDAVGYVKPKHAGINL